MGTELPFKLNIAHRFLDARIEEGCGERVALRREDRELTFAEVQSLANRFGQLLRHHGVRREERVLIALRDGTEFVGALFGILKLGAVAVMVNEPQSGAVAACWGVGNDRADSGAEAAGSAFLTRVGMAASSGSGPYMGPSGMDAGVSAP